MNWSDRTPKSLERKSQRINLVGMELNIFLRWEERSSPTQRLGYRKDERPKGLLTYTPQMKSDGGQVMFKLLDVVLLRLAL